MGLGYVGLPLAIEFGKVYETIGFDIDQKRVEELNQGNDSTLEFDANEIKKAEKLIFSSNEDSITDCNIYIVTVPTPINKENEPDLTLLENVSRQIGTHLDINDIVIYESTVYPGATEEICVPILENTSGMKFNEDFFCGYSPERVNPGDKEHRITKIEKITSGSTPEIADKIDELYRSIITAGTTKVGSIKVAEAAKVIENTQRDLNIALVNEFSIIFNKLGINTEEVIQAASTKWNFQPYKPGIVGGHCIGVDPYYLTYKSKEIGYKPEVILAGRNLNDNMGIYIADETIKLMRHKSISLDNAELLIMGFTFKENCPDHRNTRVMDIIKRLNELELKVDIHDPWVHAPNVKNDHGVDVSNTLSDKLYDAIIIAVAHDDFRNMEIEDFQKLTKENNVIFDIKSILSYKDSDGRL